MSSVSVPSPPLRTPTGFSTVWQLSALVAIVGCLFVLQLRHFSPFITDDAYISLRYSQRLLEGHGLTWNDMRPVEGYTNLLWVLLCAALGALHIPLPLAAHILGVTTTLLILLAVVLYIYREFPSELRFFSSLLTCSAMVLSSPFSMWALGGLEQPLLACLLVWATFFILPWFHTERPSSRSALIIGFLLGLAVISRADAALFTAAFFAAAVITDGVSSKSIRSRARILPLPILFFLGQLAFRRSYYHEWLPNTAYVKVAFTLHRLYTGLRYLYLAMKINAVLLALVLLASYALWRTGRKKPVVFVWTVAFIWTAYLILIGGDIFPAVRHFEPLIALFGFLLPGCGLLITDANRHIKTTAAIALLVGTALVATSDAMSEQEHWELQGESLGLLIHQAFGAQQPLLSSDAAGVVPYFAHVPVLDPLGLNDYHIAHETQRLRGHGWVGHELGDGKYILDQKPDLLLFSSFDGKGELFPADQQIMQDPRFQQYYQPVRFDTPQPNAVRALMYLRRNDGKLGLQHSSGTLLVPGYLAKVDLQNSAHLVDRKATLTIAAHHQAVFEQLPVGPGSWKLQLDSDQPSALVLGELQGAERMPGCDLCLSTAISSPITLTISNPTDAPVSLKSFTLSPR
jgi:arabinofuranosyltransferase